MATYIVKIIEEGNGYPDAGDIVGDYDAGYFRVLDRVGDASFRVAPVEEVDSADCPTGECEGYTCCECGVFPCGVAD